MKILNPHGFVIVGDTIFKMEGDIIKAIPSGDVSLIDNLSNTTTSLEDSSIIVDKVRDIKDNLFKEANDYTWNGTVYSPDGKSRCNWEKYGRSNFIFGYCYVGADIKYQEKKLLGWFAQSRPLYLGVKCDYITFNCHDGWCDIASNIKLEKQVTDKTLKLTERLGSSPVSTISGLKIGFIANSISAIR